jgi:hypothetical protein
MLNSIEFDYNEFHQKLEVEKKYEKTLTFCQIKPGGEDLIYMLNKPV